MTSAAHHPRPDRTDNIICCVYGVIFIVLVPWMLTLLWVVYRSSGLTSSALAEASVYVVSSVVLSYCGISLVKMNLTGSLQIALMVLCVVTGVGIVLRGLVPMEAIAWIVLCVCPAAYVHTLRKAMRRQST